MDTTVAGGVGARPIVLVSPDLRPSVLGVARSLHEASLLHRLVTTLAIDPAAEGSMLALLFRRGGRRIRMVLGSRQVPEWLRGRVESYPVREAARVAAQRLGLGPITCDRIWEWAETGFDRRVARDWAGRAPCLYGCEHASLETFRRQKSRGGLSILWQVIAHHRTAARILQEELKRYPETMTAYARHALRSAARVNGRKDEQYELADLIVANSDFVRASFLDAGIPASKIVAVPTGCPPVAFNEPPARPKAPMVFLCGGTQSIRKGSHHLLEAWRRLKPRSGAELWLVGHNELPARILQNLPGGVVLRPAVPRAEMKGLFRQASVLVLPTLCEGRAHVILEAVASGLPVLTTPNSGCTDIVRDGVNGWLVQVGDCDALAGRIAWCIDNADQLDAMGRESVTQAHRWQVSDFAAAHGAAIREFLEHRRVLPAAPTAAGNAMESH